MKKTVKQVLKDYEKATQELAEVFVKKYFGKDAKYWWVGDEIGGVFYVNDYWFNLDFMKEALQKKATQDQVFDYYDYSLEMAERGEKVRVNFNSYLMGLPLC